MQKDFLQLMADQYKNRVALEAAVERLFEAEKELIAANPRLPEVTRQRSQTAALELVHLTVEQKLKNLAERVNKFSTPLPPTPPATGENAVAQ